MKVLMSRMLAVVLMVGGMLATASAAEPIGPKFPQGYREWTHVKSMVIHSDKHPLFVPFGGIHHVYVNKTGLAAAKTHGKFPDGSILVFDLLHNADADGAYTEGTRKVVAVMQKDSTKYKQTAGWGFQAFKGGNPNDPTVTDSNSQCLACHQSQKDNDYVFSRFRE